jgi:hypothetical protein
MEQTVELLLGVDCVLQAVVEKLVRDRRPRGVGSGAREVDIVPNFFGDGRVQPGEDVGVHLELL